jgi:hypothetical protein
MDLTYGVGKAYYEMDIEKEFETREEGTLWWKTTKEYYRHKLKIRIADTYNFEPWEGEGFDVFINNLGLDLQKRGLITPYEWNATYYQYTSWKEL